MSSIGYPSHIYGKTWMLWACTLIIGQLACFACIMGPLFWLDILKRADGQPGSFGGIHLTVIGSLLMPIAIMFAFQLFARQWPVIRIFREGLEIREIGTPMQIDPVLNVLGIGIFLIVLFAFWQLITLQMFRVKTIRLPWEEITNIMQGKGTLSIIGSPIRETRERFGKAVVPPTHVLSYDANSFSLQIEEVGETIQNFRCDANQRQSLRSWEHDKRDQYDPFEFETR